jgi:hypothetical protein
MKWLNAVSLIVQFISFWLAAPELLGDQFLKRIQVGLKTFISKLSIIIISVVVVGFSLGLSIYGWIRGINATENGITDEDMRNYFIFISVMIVIYFIFMFRLKQFRKWMDLTISGPMVDRLVNDNNMRKNALILGAVLFTLGFFGQLIVIIAS